MRDLGRTRYLARACREQPWPAGAIVGYFVDAFAVPTISGLLAQTQGGYRDIQHWADFQLNRTGLYGRDTMTGTDWTHLAATAGIWLVLPLAIGLWVATRSEVK